ncbi:MAG: branched-chain amino acid ABC transporter permease [Spirochaetales bacterium]|nr:branched-chain amino acid ABC transporter permease [Spirochaetales bacterium]
MRRIVKHTVYTLFFLFLLVLPLIIHNDYQLFVMNRAWIHVILASGLVFLTGFAGQISLGQAGFYAVGAYTSAFLTARLGLPLPVGILTGVLLSIGLGLILSIPSFKLKAFFLSLVTIAFGQIAWMLVLNLVPITGGPGGFFNIPFFRLGNTLFTNTGYYYLFLLLSALTIGLMHRIKYSFRGRELFAVNDDETAAETCGIDSRRAKRFAFGFSAGLAGLAGSLYAHMAGFLTPEPFVFFESSNFVAMAVVGGLRHLSGGVIGGIALTWLPELLRLNIRGFENYYLIFNAAIVILIVVFLPNGLGDSLFKGLARLWKEEPPALTLKPVRKQDKRA